MQHCYLQTVYWDILLLHWKASKAVLIFKNDVWYLDKTVNLRIFQHNVGFSDLCFFPVAPLHL